jgi:hypothetical protein
MSEQPKDGGPAFPPHFQNPKGVGFDLGGMSLRDYFAAAALTKLSDDGMPFDTRKYADIAATSYRIADAMLAERLRK